MSDGLWLSIVLGVMWLAVGAFGVAVLYACWCEVCHDRS